MNKYLITIAVTGFIAFPAVTRADFTLTYGQQSIIVPAATVESWQGSAAIMAPPVFIAPLSAEQLLQQYAGNPAPATIPNLAYSNFNPSAVYGYLKNLAQQINQAVVDPAITITNNRVTAFTAPESGAQLDLYHSTMDIVNALNSGATGTPLDIVTLAPAQSLASLNNLGINTLLARGTSNFAGSPNNRRQNIAVGVQKFQGLLLAPGQEFSFDDNLGPVTAEAGFLPELVIDDGTTQPELGGGLCQVSTTTFRAAMAAGLPITDRRNHAYAVSYYSPQGTDATIYPGSADLKFINNTPGDILIWPYETDRNDVNFDFWGTTDGRQVTLEKPVAYDRQSDGAMKASWTRDITMDGTTTSQTFYSNYQSPALFHETETYVSATGTPIKPN
jgi:vancomycin resistance protein YoaR